MEAKDYIELSGIVDSVIFSNAENGYTICEIEDSATGEPVVLAGTMPYVVEGDNLTVRGSWVIHPTYGKQLRVTEYDKTLPAERGQMLRYLASGAVKGVGPKTALKIINEFEESAFDVIANHPDWLAGIPGISRKKAREISSSFNDVAGARNVMMRFRDYLSDSASMKVYKKWGSSAIDRVKENPYILCEQIDGIGFTKADAVAMSFGIEKDSEFRVSGGIVAFLRGVLAKEGHTCMPIDKLEERCAEFLEVERARVHEVLVNMLVQSKLRVTSRDDVKYIYLPAYFNAERFVAAKLTRLRRQCEVYEIADVERMIVRLERTNDIEYDRLQTEAIVNTLKSGVMILTGGPGTGKTTVIKAIIEIYRTLGMSIALAAPTGRAAKRMSEATSCEAKTIHRMLCMEYNGDDGVGKFLKDENDPLEEDVFIIDECSMIDVLLMEAFLKAVRPGSRIIFIGDADQLPPVGAGNVFSDLIKSGAFATVKLDKIYRQDEDSRIITNAHEINEGRMPDLSNSNRDFFFMAREDDEAVAATIAGLYKTRLPRTYGEDIIPQIQVMSPSRKGVCGTDNLNALLQSVMNPPDKSKRERRYGDTVFREGDRVMQTKNNYSVVWEKDGVEGEGIFNGDIGTIEKIDTELGVFVIRFDDRVCDYDTANLEELEHAWAITVHKSQGSEYPVVIMPVCPFAPMLLTRNLFYTAVTRAKRIVILVGRKFVIQKMVENDAHAVRYTGLEYMIRAENGGNM